MFRRHDLVWLTAAGWEAARTATPAHDAALLCWQEADRPLVVRRRDAGMADGEISLGLPLPPDAASGEKLRIGLRAREANVARHTPPLTMAAAIGRLHDGWQPAPDWRALLQALERDAAGMALHVYGSLAMQALTGLPYLRPGSDIDLLFYPADAAQLHAGLALLARHAASLPLDGEMVFPSADAVAWKEWLQAGRSGSRVLVKTANTVRLDHPDALLATLGAA